MQLLHATAIADMQLLNAVIAAIAFMQLLHGAAMAFMQLSCAVAGRWGTAGGRPSVVRTTEFDCATKKKTLLNGIDYC